MEPNPLGSCGVCLTPLRENGLVVCPGCRSVYHDACWTYNDGRCARYGCPRAQERDPLPGINATPWTGSEPAPILPEPAYVVPEPVFVMPAPKAAPTPDVDTVRRDVTAVDVAGLVMAVILLLVLLRFRS